MKKALLLFTATFMVACSNVDSEPIEEPTIPEKEISINNNVIGTFKENILNDQKRIDNADSDELKRIYLESIEDWEKEISLLEEENEILENTLVYNDEFKTVQGTGIYIQQHEGILNEETLISGFNRDMLHELNRYSEEISEGVILIAAAPFTSEGDKFPVISVYYSQKSLENINFENEDDNYLYDNADYVRVHDTLSEHLKNSGNFDIVPELFNYYSGQTYK